MRVWADWGGAGPVRRQLEQRCFLRARLRELEQRLVERELEHFGSNYFIQETIRGLVLRHGKAPDTPRTCCKSEETALERERMYQYIQRTLVSRKDLNAATVEARQKKNGMQWKEA